MIRAIANQDMKCAECGHTIKQGSYYYHPIDLPDEAYHLGSEKVKQFLAEPVADEESIRD